jgi:hypothetical protein
MLSQNERQAGLLEDEEIGDIGGASDYGLSFPEQLESINRGLN